MFAVFAGQESSLVVVSSLAAHRNGCVQIKFEVIWGLDEFLQFVHVFELCVAIQQQCCVVGGGLVVVVQLFQVLDQVVYPLGVQELRESQRMRQIRQI